MSEEILERNTSDWSTYSPGNHKDIKKIIKDNINSVYANYVAIGYYLNVVNDRELYKEDGYSGIGEYAAAEYGIQEDKCSWLRKVARKFCISNSPALSPEYRDFSVSKLREMIYLDEEQLKQVTVTTTVAEIRDIRKPASEKLAISQVKPESNSEIKVESPKLQHEPINFTRSLDSLAKEFEAKGSCPPNQGSCRKNGEEGDAGKKVCIGCWRDWLNLEKIRIGSIEKHDKAKAILDRLMGEEWCSLVTWRRFLEEDITKKGKEEACKDFLSFHGGQGQKLEAENGHPMFEFMLHRSYGNTSGKIELQWDNDKAEMSADVFIDLYLEYPVYDDKKPDDAPVPEEDKPEINPCDAKKPEPGTVIYDVGGSGDIGKYEVISKDSSFSPKYFTVKDKSGAIHNISVESEHWHYTRDEAKRDSWYREKEPVKSKEVNDIPVSANIEPEKVDNQPETVSESTESVIEKDSFPCDTCGHENDAGCCDYDTEDQFCVLGNAWIPKAAEPEQVETVVAEIIQTVQEVEDYERYTFQDVEDELSKLKEYVEAFRSDNNTVPGRRKAKMRLDAITLLRNEMQRQPEADESMVRKMARFAMEWFEKEDYDSTDFYLFQARKQLADNYKYERDFYPDYYNDNRLKQPELPILKNNDQRKAFIDNYETWPVWIDIPHTGEKFYRYDLSREVAMIVKVSKKHAWKGYKETKDYEYGAEQYYLLGIKAEWSQKGSKFIEDPERTFHECNTNKSALIEYLKDFQKK